MIQSAGKTDDSPEQPKRANLRRFTQLVGYSVPHRRQVSTSIPPLPHFSITKMLTIVGNIYQSLTERRSIHRVGPDLYFNNSLASPIVIDCLPSTYYTTQFIVVLKQATQITPSVIVDPETQIFFTGNLAISNSHHHPQIEIPAGDWLLHNGGLQEDVEHKVRRALVSGTVYVVEVCWNYESRTESYVKVVDCSVGKVSIFLLVYLSRVVHIHVSD